MRGRRRFEVGVIEGFVEIGLWYERLLWSSRWRKEEITIIIVFKFFIFT